VNPAAETGLQKITADARVQLGIEHSKRVIAFGCSAVRPERSASRHAMLESRYFRAVTAGTALKCHDCFAWPTHHSRY
jgi:hypothetical protein